MQVSEKVPNLANLHDASRVWFYVENSKFTLPYQALEDYFNDKAREEGFLTDKQRLNLKTIDLDASSRMLNLEVELYKLLEN